MEHNKNDIIKSLLELEYSFNCNIDCDKINNIKLCEFSKLFIQTLNKTKLYLENNHNDISKNNITKTKIVTNIDYEQLSKLNNK